MLWYGPLFVDLPLHYSNNMNIFVKMLKLGLLVGQIKHCVGVTLGHCDHIFLTILSI